MDLLLKYNVFNGDLDRVIDELIQKIETLQSKLDEATVELARMDDRAQSKDKKTEEKEDPFCGVQIGPYVKRVGYDNGELFYERETMVFYLREGVVLTETQAADPDFDFVESEETTSQSYSPTSRSVYHIALDCEGNP